MKTSCTKSKLLAISVGDPCGIGPEITAKSLAQMPRERLERLIVVGPRETPASAPVSPARFQPIDVKGPFPAGSVCRKGGAAAVAAVEKAHELCLSGECAGMITGPIGKKAIRLAGSPFSGHTDMLGALTRAPETRMAMILENWRVVMTTLHISYRDVLTHLTFQSLMETLWLTHEAFSGEPRPFPRIAVAGLNPHAGEDGLFGDEETFIITPAIREFQKVNPRVAGPFPCDSLFKQEMRDSFDAFIAHTHDQGLIAIKTLGGIRCVNVTLGLPYIRTSVGHGTAYDIAGTGKADSSGMTAAIDAAFRLIDER